MPIKQVIVIRKDLKMRRGKEVAQGAHAAMAFLRECLIAGGVLSPTECAWLSGGCRKICLQVDSEAALLRLEEEAKAAGLRCHLITDTGLTEFKGIPTRTCLALGPASDAAIDPVSAGLALY